MSAPLLKDLNELVAKNIITADTAQQIQLFYQNRSQASGSRFPTVLAILGALLLGSGLVLIIAHNWDMLGRIARTIIAFLPLALGQAACIYAFLKKNGNRAWIESAAVFLFFAVPVSISLISQVYQVNGELPTFLLTWMLLTLPLVYMMPSGVVSLLIISLATWHAALVGYSHSEIPYTYIGVMALLLANYLWYLKTPSSNFFHLHNWFITISLLVVLAAFVKDGYNNFEWTFIGYMSLLSLFYLLGNTELMQQQRWFANPFKLSGVLGIIVIFMLWTFEWIWGSMGAYYGKAHVINYNYSFAYLSLALMVVCSYLVYRQYQREKLIDLLSFSPFVFAAGVLIFFGIHFFGILLFNLWILAIGIYYTRKGAARDHLGILNFGLLLIALLAVFRFFDSDIPFIWRGLIFIAAGAGFFIANMILIRRRRAAAKNIQS